MADSMKHKKDLAILKMLEDESIVIYTLFVVVPSLFGGKRITKSGITYLPPCVNWREKILQTVLRYDSEKMLDPVH